MLTSFITKEEGQDMMRENCWEFMKCGRERPNRLGLCPAVTESNAHTVNRGKNGGRICWAVTGTLCEGKVQGTYAEKVLICSDCAFRKKVQEEERANFRQIYFAH
jgi:hypothetical protein